MQEKLSELLSTLRSNKEIVIIFAPIFFACWMYQDNVSMRSQIIDLQKEQSSVQMKFSEVLTQQVELLRSMDKRLQNIEIRK